MAHNIVDVDTWTAAVVTADDGDAFNGAMLEAPNQDLADRTRFLYNRLIGASTTSIGIPLHPAAANVGARFTEGNHFGGTVTNTVWRQTDVTDAGALYIPIQNLLNCQITGLTMHATGLADGGLAHGGDVGTMPTVALISIDLDTPGAFTVEGTATDGTSVTGGDYEAYHTVVLAGLSVSFALDKQFYIRITGEDGLNDAVNKFGVYGVTMAIAPV